MKTRKHTVARYALPIALSIAALLSLGYRSWNPILFGRYSPVFLIFFVLLVATAVQAWRVAIDERRWSLFSLRLAGIPFLQGLLLATCILFFADLTTDLVEVAIAAVRRNSLTVGFVGVAVASLLLSTMSSDSPRLLLSKAVLLAVSVSLSLVAVECVFRWVLLVPKVPRTADQFRQVVGRTWPKPVSRQKGPQTRRILGLADSFGEAGGHDNYHYLLTDLLNQSSQTYDMVNFSVSEYEPPDELALLARFGSDFQPDLVLQGFFVGNDFSMPTAPLLRWRGISIRPASGIASARPLNFTILEWLRRFGIVSRDQRTKRQEKARGSAVGSFSRDEFLRIERGRLEICRVNRPQDTLLAITNVLDAIRAEVLRMDAEHVMIIHPDQYQVETNLLREICEEYHLNAEDYDLGKPQRLIAQYCADRGIPCMDLLPVFREHGAGGGLYLLRNTHYNAEGNRLAARETARFLGSVERNQQESVGWPKKEMRLPNNRIERDSGKTAADGVLTGAVHP